MGEPLCLFGALPPARKRTHHKRAEVRGWRLVEHPRRVEFEVLGEPRPKGSMQGFVVPSYGGRQRAIVTEKQSSGSRSWQRLIASEAQRHAPAGGPLDGPLRCAVTFYLPRPASAPRAWLTLPDRKPDVDKLTRGLLDAITGVIIADDARIVDCRVRKRYSARPRVAVAAWEAGADDVEPVADAFREIEGGGPVG